MCFDHVVAESQAGENYLALRHEQVCETLDAEISCRAKRQFKKVRRQA
jgi:hypothetical protein